MEFTQTFRSTKEQNTCIYIYICLSALFGLSFIGYARVIFDLHHALIINKSFNGQLGIMYANLTKSEKQKSIHCLPTFYENATLRAIQFP